MDVSVEKIYEFLDRLSVVAHLPEFEEEVNRIAYDGWPFPKYKWLGGRLEMLLDEPPEERVRVLNGYVQQIQRIEDAAAKQNPHIDTQIRNQKMRDHRRLAPRDENNRLKWTNVKDAGSEAQKRVKQLLKELERERRFVIQTANGRHKVTCPGMVGTVTIPSTPSDVNALKSVVRYLRQYFDFKGGAFIVPPRKGSVKEALFNGLEVSILSGSTEEAGSMYVYGPNPYYAGQDVDPAYIEEVPIAKIEWSPEFVDHAGRDQRAGTFIDYLGFVNSAGQSLYPGSYGYHTDKHLIPILKKLHPTLGRDLILWVRKNLPAPYYGQFANDELAKALKAKPTTLPHHEDLYGGSGAMPLMVGKTANFETMTIPLEKDTMRLIKERLDKLLEEQITVNDGELGKIVAELQENLDDESITLATQEQANMMQSLAETIVTELEDDDNHAWEGATLFRNLIKSIGDSGKREITIIV